MSTATKNYGSVSLTSSYYAYTDIDGFRTTSNPNEANSDTFYADLATLGIPAGSTINLATFTYTIVTPSLHGYEKRQLIRGSTVIDAWFDSGDTENLASIASFFLRFKSGKGSTNYPSPGSSGVLNQSVWAISDLTLTVDYTAPGGTPPATTGCWPPTTVTVIPDSAAPGAPAYLYWSGALAGTGNPIIGYNIFRQLNSSGAFDYIGTNTLEGMNVNAPPNIGDWYYYKIISIGSVSGGDSGQSAASNALVAALTAPSVSNVRLDGSASNVFKAAGASASLSWDSADGTNNPITSYSIFSRDDGGAWSLYASGITAKSYTVNGHPTAGHSRQFYVIAHGQYSNSGAVESPILYAYGACTAPSSAGLSASVSEGDVTLSYAGAAAGAYNAITGYEIQYAESAGGYYWDVWTALKTVSNSGTSGSTAVAVSPTRGYYRKYRIRTQGAAGASFYSGWTETGSVRRNSAPAAPSVTAPAAGTTLYNSQPRILATVGADADSNAQTVAASGYTPSSGGNQAVGKKLVLRRTNAYSAGSQSVSVASTDSFGVTGSAVSRSFTYAAPSWTDGTLTAETTKIKAAHMNELRTAVNNIRVYYGMAAVSWAQAITAGSTGLGGWKNHVLELRAAIDTIVALVNGWDTASSTHNIPAISWISIPTNKPTKAVMDQLRAVIPTL